MMETLTLRALWAQTVEVLAELSEVAGSSGRAVHEQARALVPWGLERERVAGQITWLRQLAWDRDVGSQSRVRRR